ncbi:MAG: RNA-binding cell elongation regulator Jag/EloR [Ruminiclostridium sp.]
MEKIFCSKNLDDAKNQAIREFAAAGFSEDEITIEVLEQPVKKLFVTKGEYKIKATSTDKAFEEKIAIANQTVAMAVAAETEADIAAIEAEAAAEDAAEIEGTVVPEIDSDKVKTAVAYLTKVLTALGVENFKIVPIQKDDMVVLDIQGEKLGIVIGRRGETLDSLQYLSILAGNRNDEPYCRISVDCNGYREKRRETLEALATKTAQKVLKQGRRVTLEPMNPYERRIIHSKVAEIEGVSSRSTGEEPYRKVVISSNKPAPRNGGRRNDRRRGNPNAGRSYKQSSGFSTSFEREYKRTPSQPVEYSQETVDTEKNTTLYGKIEL